MTGRTKFVLWFFSFFAFLWVVYLFILQIFDPFDLNQRKLERYDEHKEFIIANRGNIYDSKGSILVNTLQYHQIDIDVQKLKQIATRNNKSVNQYYHTISDIISENSTLSKNDVYQKLDNAKNNTVVISYNIDQNQLNNIREHLQSENLNALISAYNYSKRVYARGTLAARLLGLTNGITDNTSRFNRHTFRLEGLSGIEKTYNDQLIGDYGWKKIKMDARQFKIPIPRVDSKPVKHGSSIYLTINSEIQEILESNLYKGLSDYKAKNAIGVIMCPNTGNIIAMAGINENDKKISENQLRSLQNMPTQFLFEPGSTIKPLVSLLAIEKDAVKEDDTFDCRTWKLPNRTIKDSHELGTISFRDIIVHSSNVGVSKIADILGKDDLYQHYMHFGFGTTTNIDLLEEYTGQFRKLSDWSQFTLHSISFGQEMSTTAIQMANIYCALANGGQLLKPNIVQKIVEPNGKEINLATRKVQKTISNKKAIELNNDFLLDVVEKGTGTNTRFENIKIAGKTGTSEKAVGGAYSATKFTASFAGFFPYEEPEYVMVIVYDEPEYRYRFGSQSAVPTFRNIVEEILTLPDCSIISDLKTSNQEFVTMPKLTGLKIIEAKKILNKNNIEYQLFNEENSTYITHQFPQAGVKFGINSIASLYCNSEKLIPEKNDIIDDLVMPNLVGMPLRQAIHLSKVLKFNLFIDGGGHIVSQSIKAGDRLNFQQKCVVVAR